MRSLLNLLFSAFVIMNVNCQDNYDGPFYGIANIVGRGMTYTSVWKILQFVDFDTRYLTGAQKEKFVDMSSEFGGAICGNTSNQSNRMNVTIRTVNNRSFFELNFISPKVDKIYKQLLY